MLRIAQDYDQAKTRFLNDLRNVSFGNDPEVDEYVDWHHPHNLTQRDSIILLEMMEDLHLVLGTYDASGYRVAPTQRFYDWLPAVKNGTFVDNPPEPEAFNVLNSERLEERQGLGEGVFIVHGEDTSLSDTLLSKVSHFIRENLGREPVVLDVGRKNDYLWASFEKEAAACAVAICIWTADRRKPESGFIRPNVTLETGYFIGHLGLDRVIIIRHGGVKHSPSDLAGRSYLTEENWEHHLAARLDVAFGDMGATESN